MHGGRTRALPAGSQLLTAAADRVSCPPVRDLIGDGGMAAGYAVQQLLAQQALASGSRISGRKIGLCAAAGQLTVNPLVPALRP
jgi:2-keto-4-pentenoate hydratase